jgi:hypothetical protein
MYPEAFLFDLKSRVTISEVVGRSVKLRRDGKEFRAVDNASLTVNDAKGIWFDHATNEGGDALAWLQKMQGLSFKDAVAEIASIAGLPLPNGGEAGHGEARQGKGPYGQVGREITATYDYTDAQAELIYQVVRLEWIEDGERQKTFRQRRPDPEKTKRVDLESRRRQARAISPARATRVRRRRRRLPAGGRKGRRDPGRLWIVRDHQQRRRQELAAGSRRGAARPRRRRPGGQ